MKITSTIDAVTLFPRGAQVVRLAAIEIPEGEHQLLLEDLPLGLVDNSLRVEAVVDGQLELGAVDLRRVYIARQDVHSDEYRLLVKRIEKLQDEAQHLDQQKSSIETRRNMLNNLASMPAQQGTGSCKDMDWTAIYDLIGQRLPGVGDEIVELTIRRRELQEKIDDLQGQLNDLDQVPEDRLEVKISVLAGAALKGELSICYQVSEAGWQPFYDARLDTGEDSKEAQIELVRRATIHQNSGESWQNIALTLSTTRPNAGTSAPELAPEIIDIRPDQPPQGLRQRMMKHKAMAAPLEALQVAGADEFAMTYQMEDAGEVAPVAKRVASEREAVVEQSSFQASFNVPGRVSLSGHGTQKKVRLGSERIKPRLQIRATPLLDPTAFLHAAFTLDEGVALLPGQVLLYRNKMFVGNGHMPRLNGGEKHELGFGVDDALKVRRTEKKRSKGRHGLIKTEETDERHFVIAVNNHHQRQMNIYILDRIPASNHEKLKVEELGDMSEPGVRDVDDKRGVMAYEFDLAAGGEKKLDIHYRLSWPKGEHIG